MKLIKSKRNIITNYSADKSSRIIEKYVAGGKK